MNEPKVPNYLSLIDGKPLKLNYHYFQADDGVSLAYQYLKKPGKNRQTLILLHGLGSSGADWEFQIQALNQHFDLLIPDLRGFGASTDAFFQQRHSRLSVRKMANDVASLLDHHPT